MINKNGCCKAAFSQIDITPPFPTSLVGCYRPDNRSQGVLHSLQAQVLLFQAGDSVFCLAAMDNLGLTVQLSTVIRKKIAVMLGTDIPHIMLNFSHTHSAPEPTAYGLNGEMYFEFLLAQLLKCVAKARGRLAPCKIGWSLTEAGIAENRREGCDIIDNRLGALMVAEKDSGKPIAVIIRIAAHANVLMQQNFKVSGDFIGVAREELSRHWECPVMVLQGAAGNLKPVGVEKIGGGNLADLERIAGLFASAAKKMAFVLDDVKDIRMFSREMPFVSPVPSQKDAEEIAAASGMDGAEWLSACEELRKSGIKKQSVQGEIQFFQLNEGCFCGVAEELFCELALEAWKNTGNPFLFLNGYTNGCRGYLANAVEWRKGGYEVLYSNLVYHKYHGHVMPYEEDTAENIVDLAVSEWHRLR